MGKKVTTDLFIAHAKEVHGDKYDYSKTLYVSAKTKVIIICKVHGEFLQQPQNHLLGRGCELCSYTHRGLNHRTRELDFITKAYKIHNYKYTYNNVKYVKAQSHVSITCPTHGDFQQTPSNHLNGFGCSECGGCVKLSIDEFILRSNTIHNHKYSYTHAQYINADTKIHILCPTHGGFQQTPSKHLQGQGCPKCKSSKGELKILNFLEYMNIEYISEHKFHDCVSVKFKPLPFDFYLPLLNICIEYDGQQHYKSISYFGGECGLKSTQTRDNIKTKYCNDNFIKLIRIAYFEFDNIEEILKRELN